MTARRVPRINFPGGYSIEIAGASVVSQDDAPVLRLRRQQGADSVRVTVQG